MWQAGLNPTSQDVSQVFAARAALRALPGLTFTFQLHGNQLRSSEQADTALRTFRCLQLSWASSTYPDDSIALKGAAQRALQAPPASSSDPERSATYAAATYDPPNSSEFSRAAANYAIEAVTGPRVNFVAMLDAYSRDAEMLDQRTSPVTLANSQLWPGRLPDWVLEAWDQLKQALLAASNDWIVWTDWYEERLKGRPGDQATEVARATIPDEIWSRGPATVNAHIRQLIRQRGNFRYETKGELDAILSQLGGLTQEEVSVIGARVALRTVPLLKLGPAEFEVAFLSALRAISSAWAAAYYDFQTSHDAYSGASGSRVAIVRNLGQASRASAVTPDDAPFITARGIHALRSAVLVEGGAVAAATFDLALSQDLSDIPGAPHVPALAELPIWLGDAPPEWAIQRWNKLKQDLTDAGKGWEVWIDWYEDRIAGNARSKARELAYVDVPNDIWALGPAVVNAWILNRIYELEGLISLHSIPQIPAPGPGPRFQIGESGLIDRAPLSDVDDDDNDVRTINQLKPHVQRCAADLKARLSRNEFPELLITVEQYGATLDPGNGLAINWGEVWGLGVMLQNAATAAERQIAHEPDHDKSCVWASF
jgi:hypothetical protein